MKIKQHIPNLVTCLNLVCGMAGIYFVLEGNVLWAAYLVILAAVFDFLDGFLARVMDAYSELGKQLDSLADMVTFGVLPAFLVFKLIQLGGDFSYLPFIAFLIAVQSALRLAKFNIDTRQSDRFIGLPTPANALFFSALPHLAISQPWAAKITASPMGLIALTMIFSWLLTAEIPLLALKFKNFQLKENGLRYLTLAIAGLSLALFGLGGIVFAILAYILLSLVDNALSSNADLA
ncbi:MAG TPA: CDP-diacylglycerol--serine O-phosphatidyltransferase [Lunatimonas sp.]|nr:CDP-diacylglycerol--serine O-phosphatidyltransferase [Lunatimonas sp.]